MLPPLRLQCSLQADTFLFQAQLATLQQAAFVLQLPDVGLQLLQLLAALCLGFAEPRRCLGLSPQQSVCFLQLETTKTSQTKKIITMPSTELLDEVLHLSESDLFLQVNVLLV